MNISRKELDALHTWACLKYRDIPSEEVRSAINMRIALVDSIPEGANKTLYLQMLARNATLNAIAFAKRLKRNSRLDEEFIENLWYQDGIEYPPLDTAYYIDTLEKEEKTVLNGAFVREETVEETLTVSRCSKSAYYRRYHKGLRTIRSTFNPRPRTVKELQAMPVDKFARAISTPDFKVYKIKKG